MPVQLATRTRLFRQIELVTDKGIMVKHSFSAKKSANMLQIRLFNMILVGCLILKNLVNNEFMGNHLVLFHHAHNIQTETLLEWTLIAEFCKDWQILGSDPP